MRTEYRIAILSWLMTLCAAVAIAQPKVPREVQFGVLGGVNMSQYRFQPSITQSMSNGFVMGAGVRYIEEKIFGLQAEVLLTQRGIKDRYDAYPQYSFERTLTYIEVPILAHVYFNMGKRNEISLDAGPKLGYYLGGGTKSKTDSEYQDMVVNMTVHRYAHHDMPLDRKFDYGIQAGLGYEFKLSRDMSLQVQGRYYYGLGNMFHDMKSDTYENSSNQSVQIVTSLWFHRRIKIRKK
ncbi:MAG: PorT family protein [Bacteroidales bacterium]|nr:PorT family protein [Candidatus Liminaster caballi]